MAATDDDAEDAALAARLARLRGDDVRAAPLSDGDIEAVRPTAPRQRRGDSARGGVVEQRCTTREDGAIQRSVGRQPRALERYVARVALQC